MSSLSLSNPEYLQQFPEIWPAARAVIERTHPSRLRNIGDCPESLNGFPMKGTRDED